MPLLKVLPDEAAVIGVKAAEAKSAARFQMPTRPRRRQCLEVRSAFAHLQRIKKFAGRVGNPSCAIAPLQKVLTGGGINLQDDWFSVTR